MLQIPTYISGIFIAITGLTIAAFYLASNKNNFALSLILLTVVVQAILAYKDFFLVTDAIPPRLLFLIAPALVLILYAFTTTRGKYFTDQINLEKYTYLQSIRIIVELVLLSLFIHGTIPVSMTFEGRNFDIVSGITAPFIAYYGFHKKSINPMYILLWNFLCLALVLQVVITGILSAPSVIQKLSFDQPNIAVLYFPFVWLPGIVVPIVIYGHLVSIRQLLKDRSVLHQSWS